MEWWKVSGWFNLVEGWYMVYHSASPFSPPIDPGAGQGKAGQDGAKTRAGPRAALPCPALALALALALGLPGLALALGLPGITGHYVLCFLDPQGEKTGCKVFLGFLKGVQ